MSTENTGPTSAGSLDINLRTINAQLDVLTKLTLDTKVLMQTTMHLHVDLLAKMFAVPPQEVEAMVQELVQRNSQAFQLQYREMLIQSMADQHVGPGPQPGDPKS